MSWHFPQVLWSFFQCSTLLSVLTWGLPLRADHTEDSQVAHEGGLHWFWPTGYCHWKCVRKCGCCPYAGLILSKRNLLQSWRFWEGHTHCLSRCTFTAKDRIMTVACQMACYMLKKSGRKCLMSLFPRNVGPQKMGCQMCLISWHLNTWTQTVSWTSPKLNFLSTPRAVDYWSWGWKQNRAMMGAKSS